MHNNSSVLNTATADVTCKLGCMVSDYPIGTRRDLTGKIKIGSQNADVDLQFTKKCKYPNYSQISCKPKFNLKLGKVQIIKTIRQ